MGLKREKMCINSYNMHWLPAVLEFSGSGVILCQCGFIQEKGITGLYPPISKLWECSCWWCQRTLGFVLVGQTLHHWAVLT